jgi:hypothetical protein
MPLIVVDVDEVLAMFMRGFERFIGQHGWELRLERFALFQNIYRPGGDQVISMVEGRKLFDDFFALERHEIDVAPGARAALESLAEKANIVILTNAPEASRTARSQWLLENGFPYPLLLGSGPKGGPVAALAALTNGPTAFIDDLLPNLDSVATEAPGVRRFQMVADERLRPLAPSAPDRHLRIDDWAELGPAIAAQLGL